MPLLRTQNHAQPDLIHRMQLSQAQMYIPTRRTGQPAATGTRRNNISVLVFSPGVFHSIVYPLHPVTDVLVPLSRLYKQTPAAEPLSVLIGAESRIGEKGEEIILIRSIATHGVDLFDGARDQDGEDDDDEDHDDGEKRLAVAPGSLPAGPVAVRVLGLAQLECRRFRGFDLL